MTPVRGRQVPIDHLDGGQFFQHGPGSQPRCQSAQTLFKRHLQAIAHEGNEEMSLDARIGLVID